MHPAGNPPSCSGPLARSVFFRRFNHDVAAYLQSKPAELPGRCPFSAAPACPYGITCRWASSHPHPDELTRRFLLDGQQQQAQAGQEQEGQQEQQNGGVEAAAVPAASQPAGQQVADGDAGWWRGDGTVPTAALELPVSAQPPQAEAINTLSKDLQSQLRWACAARRRWPWPRACRPPPTQLAYTGDPIS